MVITFLAAGIDDAVGWIATGDGSGLTNSTDFTKKGQAYWRKPIASPKATRIGPQGR